MRIDARRLRRAVLLAVTLALTGITATLLMSPRQPPLPVLDDLGGAFTLPSTLGRDASLADFEGELVLLNFGFTNCPDICPTALAKMRALLLDAEALGITLRPLFVTLDPERDSLATLTGYLGHFHPTFVGLTGTREQIDAVAAQFRVLHERRELESSMDYAIDHSSHIYLIDRRGRVRAMFGASHRLPDMVDDVRRAAGEQT
jgi:protein SCO1/2